VEQEADPSPSLIDHLETQMMTLRNELSTLYRTQAASQNKQLQMADALRDRDEEVRGMREEVRLLREAKEASAKKEREWEERWRYRTKDMEVCSQAGISLIADIERRDYRAKSGIDIIIPTKPRAQIR
jgi:hypothetical protein